MKLTHAIIVVAATMTSRTTPVVEGFGTVPPAIRSARGTLKIVSKSKLYLDGEGMAGGTMNKHILGDILRSLQPRYLSQVKDSIYGNLVVGSKTVNVTALERAIEGTYVDGTAGAGASSLVPPPSWDELLESLRSQQGAEERAFRSKLERGEVHSALATHRNFPARGDTGRKVIFYKDSASWCPYCQKVWMTLEELEIPYEVVKVDMNCYAGSSKPQEFLKIQPSGTLPCVVIQDEDGEGTTRILRDSDEILTTLDSFYTTPKSKRLLPADDDTEETSFMEFLCDDGRNSLERRLYAEWMWYLTGKRKPYEYRQRYEEMLDEVDETLSLRSGGPYFFGKELTMADIKFIPFVERQEATLLYFKGFQLRNEGRWPHLVKWLRAMENRASYLPTKSDVYTHSRTLPPQLSGGCSFGPDAEEYEPVKDAIDALALPTHDQQQKDLSQEQRDWVDPGYRADKEGARVISSSRREAAERILQNRNNIVRFASRGAGTPGFPAASAELSDPKATSNDDITVAVDLFLRYAVSSLLRKGSGAGNESFGEGPHMAAKILIDGGDDETSGRDTILALVDCLDYLRARVGVPRDMSTLAARELRKELNLLSQILMSGVNQQQQQLTT